MTVRTVYRRIGGGGDRSAFALSERDLVDILSAHFGFDPETSDISGLRLDGDEICFSSSAAPEPEGAPVTRPGR